MEAQVNSGISVIENDQGQQGKGKKNNQRIAWVGRHLKDRQASTSLLQGFQPPDQAAQAPIKPTCSNASPLSLSSPRHLI